MKYILASASPRRRELLEQAGFRFQVIPSSVEEKITKDAPSEIVMELASQKARDVYEHYGDADCVVIGADTIVAYNGEILESPPISQKPMICWPCWQIGPIRSIPASL